MKTVEMLTQWKLDGLHLSKASLETKRQTCRLLAVGILFMTIAYVVLSQVVWMNIGVSVVALVAIVMLLRASTAYSLMINLTDDIIKDYRRFIEDLPGNGEMTWAYISCASYREVTALHIYAAKKYNFKKKKYYRRRDQYNQNMHIMFRVMEVLSTYSPLKILSICNGDTRPS